MTDKRWILPLILGTTMGLLADTWVWTGAQDAFWTNAANWTVGGVVATVPPGRYLASDGTLTGVGDASAEFPALAEGRPTTIDLSGAWDVRNLTVKGGAPRYTFGTANSQALCISADTGRFIAEAGSQGALFVAQFGCARSPRMTTAMGATAEPRVENWSTAELEFQKFWYMENDSAVKQEHELAFWGTGDIRISGMAPYRTCQWLDLYQTGGAKTIIACDVTAVSKNLFRKIRNAANYTSTIEIAEGGVLSGYYGMGPFEISGTLNVTGAGEFRCLATTKNKTDSQGVPHLGGGEYQNNTQTVNGRVTFSCRMTSEQVGDYYGSWYHYSGAGTTEFTGDNQLRGPIQMASSSADHKPTLRVATIGTDEAVSSLGYAPLHLANEARLLYTGTGETCSRTICLTNRSSQLSNSSACEVAALGVVEQGGTGKLTFNSPVRCRCEDASGTVIDSATLVLANATDQDFDVETALADDDGVKLNLIKRGTGVVTLKGANTCSGTLTLEAGVLTLAEGAGIANVSRVLMQGGTLRLTHTLTLPPLTMRAENAQLEVANGVTVTLNGITGEGGLLDIVTQGSGKVQVAGATAGTVLPPGLTLNGQPAECDGSGTIVRRTYVATVNIPARGGRIPNAAAEVVGITSAGDASAGPVTLADGLSTASVGVLYQRTDTPAEVALAAGQTLKANTLAMHTSGSALTVGTAESTGTLAPASTYLEFDNASTTEPLTVNAAVTMPSTSADFSILGEGLVRLLSPFDWAGTITLSAGTLALANDGQTALNAKLKGRGTFRKEGAGVWTLSLPQPDFRGEFVVADGKVKPPANYGVFGSGTLSVTNGGQIWNTTISDSLSLKDREMHLAGRGPDGSGALRVDASVSLPKQVILDGDTLISNKASVTLTMSGTTLNMNGHDLELGMDTSTISMTDVVVTNAGRWLMSPLCLAANSWNYLTLRGGCDLGTADDPEIIFTNGSRFDLDASQKPIYRRLVLDIDASKVGPEASFTRGLPYRDDGGITNFANWAGPIEIRNANTWLSFHPWESYRADRYLTFSGPISGAGGVNCGYGGKSGVKGHVFITNPHNTYAGPTKLNGAGGSSITFLHPGSMPNWDNLDFYLGRIGLCWGEGLWDKASYLAAANNSVANYNPMSAGSGVYYMPSVLAINTTYAPGRTAEIALTDADITGPNFSIGHDGEGLLTVTGSFTKPVRFGSFRGTLRFTGEGPITLGPGIISSDWDLHEGDCRIEDAQDVRQTIGNITVGGYSNVNDANARLTIANSKVTKLKSLDATWWAGTTYDSLMVGSLGRGVVEVTGNSVVTNRFMVGYGTTGRGALYVKSGLVTDLGVEAHSMVGGGGGCGAIRVSDGYFDVAGIQYQGNGIAEVNGERFGGWTTFTQTGGRTEIHPSGLLGDTYVGGWYIGSSDMARACVYISGGVVTNQRDTVLAYGVGVKSVFTMDGGEFVNLRPANPTRNVNDTVTIMNFNGGVFTAWNVARAHPGGTARADINFNGGTYRPNQDNGLFGSTTDGIWNVKVDRVTLYAKGAIFDTSEQNASLDVPMGAPTGQGVSAVNFVDPGNTFVGSPFVDIIGDGTGASAYAVFDEAAKAITEIKMTSPGNDYTWAKSVIRYGTKVWTNDCTLAANDAGGGIVKKGEKKLTLLAPNTYTGDTVLEEGDLVLGVAGALPAESRLVLKGGRIVVGTGVARPAFNLKLTVGETGSYPDTLTLAEGSTVYVANLDQADKAAAPYTLLEAGGPIAGTFTLANPEDLPANWNVRINANRIRLARERGICINFR